MNNKLGIISVLFLLSMLWVSCDKDGVDPHERFISNYYGNAYQIKNADTVDSLFVHIIMTETHEEVSFKANNLALANDTFEKHDDAQYVVIAPTLRKVYEPTRDSLKFWYYRWSSDTTEWYFSGELR